MEGILAIVDADFWNLEKTSIESSNILSTDTHDLETMILRSGSLDKVVKELVDSTRAKSLCKPIRILLLENALPIGYLRWINSPQKENLCLDFTGLNFENLIDQKTFIININRLIDAVKENSNDYSLDSTYIKSIISDLEKDKHDPWQVCSGHDIIQILSIGLNRNFGYRGGLVTLELLHKIIRLSYSYVDFQQTDLFKEMLKWEEANNPFKILLRFSLAT
ncbi:MAG: DUF4435 domain-containing protein [Methanothrix sp.]|jgi:hypothetical protein|nr:DUF4435 domain-containing protein [Methanothrix sp.]